MVHHTKNAGGPVLIPDCIENTASFTDMEVNVLKCILATPVYLRLLSIAASSLISFLFVITHET